MPVSDYDPIFEAAGQEWNVDPTLLKAMAHQESGGNPTIISRAGAQGVMQLMPQTQKAMGVADPNDPVQSIYGGAKYMAQLLDKYGTPARALAAYNAGPDRVDGALAGKSGLPTETVNYVPAVASHYTRYAAAKKSQAPAQSGPPDVGSMSDADFLAHTTGGGASSSPSAGPSGQPSGVESDEDFLTRTTGGAKPSQAQPTQPATADASTQPAQPSGPPTMLEKVGAGLASGLHSLTDKPAEYLAKAADAAGLTSGQGPQTAAADQAAQQAYQQQYGDSTIASVARIGGQIAGTAPLLMAGTGLLGAAGGMGAEALGGAATGIGRGIQAGADLLTGTASAPGAGLQGLAGNALARGGGLAVNGALTGAAGAALVGDDPVAGAQFGALAGPAAGAVASGIGAPINRLVAPFTASGRNSIADQVINKFAGGGPRAIDLTQYVPGSYPTLAEATGNPGIVGLQKSLGSQPGGEMFLARKTENSSARNALMDQVAGSPESIELATNARDATALPKLAQAFANQQPVDPMPVLSKINDILTSPDGQRAEVRSAMARITNRLTIPTPGGNVDFQRMPDQLYGIRGDINDMLGQGNMSPNTMRVVSGLKNELDKAIESGAPGFKDYLDTYSDMSKPIDQQKLLQGLNLTDAQGNITLNKVNNALSAIEKKQNTPGSNTAKSLTDDQVNALKSMQNDLLRQSNMNMKAPGIGSDTVPNAAYNASLGSLGVPLTALGYLTGGMPGGMIGRVAGALGNAAMGAQNEKVKAAIINKLLNPEAANLAPVQPFGWRPNVSPYAAPAGTVGYNALTQQGTSQ